MRESLFNISKGTQYCSGSLNRSEIMWNIFILKFLSLPLTSGIFIFLFSSAPFTIFLRKPFCIFRSTYSSLVLLHWKIQILIHFFLNVTTFKKGSSSTWILIFIASWQRQIEQNNNIFPSTCYHNIKKNYVNENNPKG